MKNTIFKKLYSLILIELLSLSGVQGALVASFTNNGSDLNVTFTGSFTVEDASFFSTTTGVSLASIERLWGNSSFDQLFSIDGAKTYSRSVPTTDSFFNNSFFNNSATVSTGDSIGFTIEAGSLVVYLPTSYTLGTAISNTTTFGGINVNSLGLNVGSYDWGTITNSSITFESNIPEPSSLILCALGGVFLVSRRQRTF